MVKYKLKQSKLGTSKEPYIAQVHSAYVYDYEKLTEEILKRGSTLTKSDILAVLNSLTEVCCDISQEGACIHTPLFKTRISIKGGFNSQDDVFDSSRHKAHASFVAGTLLKDALKTAKVQRTASTKEVVLKELVDFKGQVLNSSIYSSKPCHLRGSELELKEGDALYFVDSSGSEHQVQDMTYNQANLLVFTIPALALGTYQLILRKDGRDYALDASLECLG